MKQRTHWLAGFAAAALLMTTVATASAYVGQVESSITVAPRGTVTCTAPFTLEATVLDNEGQPVVGQSVAWSWVRSPSPADRINATPTVTNAAGVATTTVTLGSASGRREIRATAGQVQASAVVSAACGGLPSTTTAPAGSGGVPAFPAELLVAGLIGAAGVGLALRRRAATQA